MKQKPVALCLSMLAAAMIFTGASKPGQDNRKYLPLRLKSLYDSAGFKGCMLLYDEKGDQYHVYDMQAANQRYSPASTFKIPNTMISLETGVVRGANDTFRWDGTKRWSPNWNADQDLKSAFRNSTVWYYQELARRIGPERMKHWIDTLAYGNRDVSGPVDMFWLNRTLRISPAEQIAFLKKLRHRELPFSKRTFDITADIMLADSCSAYTLRAKTGWGQYSGGDIGWYVGYFETADNTWYFAHCIFTRDDTVPDKLIRARKEIVYTVMHRLGVIPAR